MRRLFVFLVSYLCFSLNGISQEISLYKVSADSLVSMINQSGQRRVYYVKDSTGATFTFDATKEDFYQKALEEMNKNGYVINDVYGCLLVLRGNGITTQLPTSYYGNEEGPEEDSSEYVKMLSAEKTVASLQNITYDIGRKDRAKAGKVYLSGFVRDVLTGEPIVGASVYDERSQTFTLTDEFGFYKMYVPTGEKVLKISFFSYEDANYNVNVYETGVFDVMIKEKVYALKVAVISAESSNNRSNNQIGLERVRIDRIKHVPSVFGEADVIKVLLTLPGVKSVGEASSGLNVRGGASDQNLILYNGCTVYNPSHLFGMFSLFNPDIVSDVELMKSSIPAQYGGRISSVLDVKAREGNKKKITGSVGLGLLTAKAHMEGPISSKVRFIAGARATYSDWMLGLLPQSSGYRNGTASFYDANLAVTYDVNTDNTLYAYGYYSLDKFKFSTDTSYKYHNINASLKWRRNISDQHSMIFQTGYDQYDYTTFDLSNPVNAYQMSFNIQEAFLKLNLKSTINRKHTFSYGINSQLYYLRPGSFVPSGNLSLVAPEYLDTERAVESALFFSDTWNITDNFSADLGLRLSTFANLKPFTFYFNPELRVSARYLANDWLTIKAGFNSMTQYVHMLTNSASASPTDIWTLSSDRIKPQTGWQAAVGLYTVHLDNKLEITLEGYYKEMKNYLDYKSGATLVMNHNLPDDVINTRGRAYGIELMLKKPLGKLNGWISYSYSRTQLKDISGQPIPINEGRWYSASYDKPHDFKLVGNFKFTHRISLSLNLDYATGRPVTVPDGIYYSDGGYRMYYSERNSYRIPDYFRMDAAINIEPSHYLKHLAYFSLTIGVYNVTGRKNAYSVYYTSDEGMEAHGNMLCIFGAPIPYLTFNFKF